MGGVVLPSAAAINMDKFCNIATTLNPTIGDPFNPVDFVRRQTADCSAGGTFEVSDDGVSNSEYQMKSSVALGETSESLTIVANGEAHTQFESDAIPSQYGAAEAAIHVDLRGEPGKDYVVTAAVVADVAFDRNVLELRSEAEVSIRVYNCGEANSLGLHTGGGLSGAQTATANAQCILRADPAGLITSVRMSLAARVEDARGGPNQNALKNASYAARVAVTARLWGKGLAKVGGPTEGVAGADPSFPQPFVVRVFKNNTNENAVGEAVVFNLKNLAGAVVQSKTKETGADGMAAENFSVADPGNYTVEAACGGCVEGSPAVFAVSVKAIETFLELVPGAESGDGQKEKVGTSLPIPLRVRVRDTAGNKRAGFRIDFSLVASPSGSSPFNPYSPTSAVTDDEGVAQTIMTLGDAVGTYETEATCVECTGVSGGFGVAATGGGGAVSGKKQRLKDTAAASRPKSQKGDKGQGGANHPIDECRAWIVQAGEPSGNSHPSDTIPVCAFKGMDGSHSEEVILEARTTRPEWNLYTTYLWGFRGCSGICASGQPTAGLDPIFPLRVETDGVTTVGVTVTQVNQVTGNSNTCEATKSLAAIGQGITIRSISLVGLGAPQPGARVSFVVHFNGLADAEPFVRNSFLRVAFFLRDKEEKTVPYADASDQIGKGRAALVSGFLPCRDVFGQRLVVEASICGSTFRRGVEPFELLPFCKP